MDPGSPAALLEADRRARQQLGVLVLARQLGRPAERPQSVEGSPGSVAGVPEVEVRARRLRRVRYPERQRGTEQLRRLVVGKRRRRGTGRQQAVSDRRLGAADGNCRGVVVGERGQAAALLGGRTARDKRICDTEMNRRAACRRQALDHRQANELVAESVCEPA